MIPLQRRQEMQSLDQELADWHQRMQDSTGSTWESMKDGFNDAFDELSEAWQSAEQNVRHALEEN